MVAVQVKFPVNQNAGDVDQNSSCFVEHEHNKASHAWLTITDHPRRQLDAWLDRYEGALGDSETNPARAEASQRMPSPAWLAQYGLD